MDPNVGEWLHLVFRWMHIIAAVMWIGSSIFFNWLDSHLEKRADAKEGVEGELWMVHSGGFYQVEKKLVAPSELPATLHWFKWEAAFTWISGICLLGLLYYMGGGMLLVDPMVSSISVGKAIALCIGTLVVTWAIYDAAWNSPLGKGNGAGAIVVMIAMIVGVAFGLQKVLTGRGAYMHVGAMMGTWMVANVWMRIIPAQRALVAAVKEGKKPDEEKARRAKQRSRHNNYMTYPVIFVMISNHFPETYGNKLGWLILAGFMLAGAGVRHYQNTKGGSPKLLFAAMGVLIVLAHVVSLKKKTSSGETVSNAAPGNAYQPPQTSGGPTAAPATVDPATVGSIKGVIKFTGNVPPPKELAIPGSCPHEGAVLEKRVIADDGKLQNVFVWISDLQGWTDPPPQQEVVVDQRGCMYAPRVVGVQVGQSITFLNSDPVMHNVHSYGEQNQSFNAPMPGKDQKITRTFDAPEVMVKMKCDIHPWMTAYVGVVPHPYYAVTGTTGEFTFDKVPPGEYTIEAWHEVYGKKTQHVSLAAKGAATTELVFAGE
jgi:uncharacterized membrane protein/plastocyanin